MPATATTTSRKATINANDVNTFNPGDEIKFGGAAIELGAAHKISMIDLYSFNASMKVSENLTLGGVVSNDILINTPSLAIDVMNSKTLILSAMVDTAHTSQASMLADYADYSGLREITRGVIESVTVNRGAAVTIKAGITIGGHTLDTDQTFTNTTGLPMKLVFNDEANAFDLQPAGEVADLS
jgi:hypothetical protein